MGTPAEPVTGLPVALTIAGSDSGGGAGIQTDLKVFFALGCHGTSAVTALTAQNTVGVTGVHEVPAPFVEQQISTVVEDIGVDAAKTGMLGSAAIVETVADTVVARKLDVVVDPVFVSKHGHLLLAEDAVAAMKSRLLPAAMVVTPNLFEAGGLLDRDISNLEEMEDAARRIHDLGARNVLIKGGHLEGEAVDVLFDGSAIRHLEGPRYDTSDTHGTGCALSAAIAARLAHGDDVHAAVDFAKKYVSGAIKKGLRLGRGHGPVNPGWDLPGAAGS